MKKIIAGMIYRLIRGYELWALIALLITASIFFYHNMLSSAEFISIDRTGIVIHEEFYDQEIEISGANIRQYRFEGLGISAADAYKGLCGHVSDEVDEILTGSFNYADDEIDILCKALANITLMPVLLIVIFIPVFYGRMFSDGTVKNYISSGHKKTSVYVSALLLTFLLETALTALNFLILTVLLFCFGWKPPIYLPVVFTIVMLSILLMFVITSVCLMVLFVSLKKTASFVVGFILAVNLIFPFVYIPISVLEVSKGPVNVDSEYIESLNEIKEENSPVTLDRSFDLAEFNVRSFYKGKEICVVGESTLKPFLKNTLLTIIYFDPGLSKQLLTQENIYGQPYLIYRDGIAAVNCVSSLIWLFISNGIGILVFRKREIQC